MPIDLQDSVVYGPIHSRRLGHSLGINLLPLSWKLCDFDCVYCQYGWTPQTPGREKIKRVGELEPLIEEAFKGFREAHETIDCITLAGNGEPALHPDFMEIIRATKRLRDIYFPEARYVFANYDVFNRQNDAERRTFEDIFWKRMFR